MQPGPVAGRTVAELRRARGWTQEALRRRLRRFGLDWSRETVSAFEAGRRADLTMSEVVLLSKALGISVAELFVGPGRVDVGDATMSLADFRARISPARTGSAIIDDPFASVTESAWARQLGLLPDELRAATDGRWGQTADERIAMIVERLVREGRRPNEAALEEAEREAFAELEQLLQAGSVEPADSEASPASES